MGQGLMTKLAQIVAEEFQVSLDTIIINATRTDKVPNTSPTAASSGTDINGMAVLNAVRKLKRRLEVFVHEEYGATPDEIVFEASSYVDGAPQTDWEKHPSDLKITINGIELKTITLPSSPADARGALSYINGIPGKYGFLTKIKVDDEQLNSLRNSLSGNKLTVGYQVDPEAENPGGLTIYGARVGRYPLDPYIIIS